MGRHPHMRRRALVTFSLAATVLSGVGPLGDLASADQGAEAVLAPVTRSIVPGTIQSAGTTGFVHQEVGSDTIQWTSYATGETTEFPKPDDYAGIIETSSDSIAYRTTSDSGVPGVTVIDPADGTTRSWTIPDDSRLGTVRGDTLLVSYSSECHLLQLGDSVSDRLVTGVPAGAFCSNYVKPGSESADEAVVEYQLAGGGSWGMGVVDFRTAVFTPLPTTDGLNSTNIRLTKDYVSWYDQRTRDIEVVPRSDMQATPRTVHIDSPYALYSFLVGDQVLWTNRGSGVLNSIAPDGSSTPLLSLAYAEYGALGGPDGSLLVTGRDPEGNYAVQRFTAGDDGVPVRTEVSPTPWHDSHSSALALSHGSFMSYETDPRNLGLGFYDRQPALTGTPVAGSATKLDTSLTRSLATPDCGASCPPLYATDDGAVFIRLDYTNGHQELVVVRAGSTKTVELTTSTAFLTIEGVSGRYVAVAVKTPTTWRTEVYDTGSLSRVYSGTGGVGVLWGNTLWRAASGKLTATSIPSGTTTRSLNRGGTCTVSRLQASVRQLYWECGDGAPTTAGVVDVATGATRSVATLATPGLLGDGYVARLDADKHLVLTTVTGTATNHVIGTANSPVPGVGWAVDPYGDELAYADTDGAVHVVRTGVATVAMTQIDGSAPGTAAVAGGKTPWQLRSWLSKPAASWSLALKNKATGVTVRTLSGGATRALVSTAWDGKTSGGALVPNGTYTWTLTVKPADGKGAALVKSGTFKLSGAAEVRHDFNGPSKLPDGVGDLVTLNPLGQITYQQGDGAGKFTTKRTGTGWPTSVTVVPFGDMGADHCNDMLIRMASGELRRYMPACSDFLGAFTPHTSLGTGWNAYDILTSPGDLTGDGRADLLARNKSTHDIYLFAWKSDGKLAAGKRIRTNWGFAQIVGAGDLDGDGIGDVLARDKDGTLYRYSGTGTGLLKDRVVVFTGWGSSYNTVVGVGDITGDGKADIVERDTSGNLYRNNGNGKGSFGSRTRIATGYKGYVSLS